MPKIGQLTKRAQLRGLLNGISKHLANKRTHHFMGETHSTKALTALFQSHIDALDEIEALRAALAGAIAEERAIAERAGVVAMGLKLFVSNLCGNSPVVLGDFGWAVPKKPGPKTVAAKLAGAEKARATRKARGTMGSRERKRSDAARSRA